MSISPIRPFETQSLPLQQRDAGSFDLIRRLQAPVWVFDIDHSRILFANSPACELWGAENEVTLQSRDLAKGMSATVKKRLKQYQTDFLQSDPTFSEQWTLYPNGTPKSVMIIFRGYVLQDGRMAMQCEAIGVAEDEPQNLRSAEALLHTDVKIALYSEDGPPLYLNPAARNALASSKAGFSRLFVERSDFETAISQVNLLGEHRAVVKVHAISGERWYDLSIKKCADAATGQPAMLLTAIDVNPLKEARDTARFLADRDQLTNLYNRAYLQNHLTTLSTQPNCGECAIIFFDVDRFKKINDRYSHETGDEVLKAIAKRTTSNLRRQDLAARLGGDEFVVLLEGVSNRSSLLERVAVFEDAISKPLKHNNTLIDVTVSIGVALFSPQKNDFTDALHEADLALYASKQSGRNRTTFFDAQMGKAAKDRDQIESELRSGIQNKEFILHYQPKLDISSGNIVGVEGLVRWEHPERGIIMPNEFISICEETGLIEDLGRLILEIGCKQAIAWRQAGFDIDVSLNVSPRQFSDEGFMQDLVDLSRLPNFPKNGIELEITETVLIGDHKLIAEKLQTMTAIGYRIAIDDFGTGYSSLSYISRFPLNCLKIDRSFIEDLPKSGPIVDLIITLGKQIGATVVSEGVETTAQLDWLTQHDCDQAQGYLIARPLVRDEIAPFLAGSKRRKERMS